MPFSLEWERKLFRDEFNNQSTILDHIGTTSWSTMLTSLRVKGSPNFMVTVIGSCVKWPLLQGGAKTLHTNWFILSRFSFNEAFVYIPPKMADVFPKSHLEFQKKNTHTHKFNQWACNRMYPLGTS